MKFSLISVLCSKDSKSDSFTSLTPISLNEGTIHTTCASQVTITTEHSFRRVLNTDDIGLLCSLTKRFHRMTIHSNVLNA